MRRTYIARRSVLRLGGALLLASRAVPSAFAQAANNDKIKIGIIGSGHVGSTIGTLWVKAGHPVLFSSRHPDELKDLVSGLGPLARAGTPAEAAAFGEAVFIAVPYSALPQVGRETGHALAGKVVLDACNPNVARDGEIANTAKEKGVGIMSQELLPGTHVVRAFNSMSYKTFARDAHRPGPPSGHSDRRRRRPRAAGRLVPGAGCRFRAGRGWAALQRVGVRAWREGGRQGGGRVRTPQGARAEPVSVPEASDAPPPPVRIGCCGGSSM